MALTLVLTLASLVQTDMGNAGARAAGKERAPRTLLESTETTSYIVSLLHFRYTCYRPSWKDICMPWIVWVLLLTYSYLQIDNATKQDHSEKFFDETIDKIHPW